MDCIFCKIIAGDIACTKLYEDDHVFVFLDIAPINKGHALVIPKKHTQNLYTLSNEELHYCIDACQKIAIALKSAVNADGINLGMNNDKPAGQLVMHAHFHVIPRFSGDGLKHWPGGKYADGEAEALCEKIKKSL